MANLKDDSDKIKANYAVEPSATENTKGLIRIATEEEAIEGINSKAAITPETLRKVTYYEHTQGVAADTWLIVHNLNKKPSITVIDTAGNTFVPARRYIDNNTVVIKFKAATKGTALLN